MEKIRKQKKLRTKKDPSAPKKAMTAFLLYLQENCPKYKQQHPNLAHREAIVKLGELWKVIPEEEKFPYQQKAKAEKELYDKRMREYQSRSGID